MEIVRSVVASDLGWPARGEACDETGLGCNRAYADLRGLTWAEARRVFALECDLASRVESAGDPSEEYAAIEDEYFDLDQGLYGLDLGIASAVISLSAAKCVPFSSCNGGAFGGHHHETYPLVAFYAPVHAVELLVTVAEEAGIGLEGGEHLVAYANDIRNMGRFASSLMSRSPLFNAIRTRRPRSQRSGTMTQADQYILPLE